MTREEFYDVTTDQGKKRYFSRELDFGVQWRDGYMYPTFRVTWVEATGEVYAVRLINDEREQPIEILGIVDSEAKVEEYLKGWADKCTGLNSLDWVRNILAN